MNKFQWGLLVVAVGLLAGPRLKDKFVVPSQSVVTVTAPSVELQLKVAGITAKLAGHPQAKELGQFYRAYGDVVQRDTSLIVTTKDFRTLNERVVTLRFDQLLTPKVPGLAAAIDAVLVGELGLEVGPFGPVRAKAVAALQAVGWACVQAK